MRSAFAFATFGCSHNSCAGELPRSASSHFICTNQQGSRRMYILQIMPSLLICTTTSTNQVLPYFQQLVQPVLPRVSSWLELGNLLGVIQSFPYQTNNFNQISFNIFSFTIASLLGNRGTNYHHRRIQIQFLVASWWEKVA